MASFNHERVGHALDELLQRIVPDDPNDSEEQAEQRLQDAYDESMQQLMAAGEPSAVPDVTHIASLLEAKIAGPARDAHKSARLHNLLGRLEDQPVLNEKWRMLYFLHELSDLPTAAQQNPSFDSSRSRSRGPTAPAKHQPPSAPAYDDPAFGDAFAKQGLPQYPAHEPSPKASTRPAPPDDRVERRKERRTQEASKEQAQDAAHVATITMGPSETELLRDLPFTLQGLSSSKLVFPSSTALKLPASLPVPIVGLLHTLAEPAILYKGLAEFVESSEGDLIGQSFRSALGKELRAYLGLVATLEGQIRRALTQLGEGPAHQGVSKAGVTLKRCVIWTRDATMGLRLMSLMVEQSKSLKGGQLISLIHSFSLNHGDPYVMSFAERLLSDVTRPFYDMLRQWVYDGELSDPYGEFFVSEQNEDEMMDVDQGKGGATSVWEDKYKLNDKMVPTIVADDFARRVFLIGKTLNFIRYGCGDANWVDTYSKEASKELHYGDTANLERSIGDAYKTTMARLIELMGNKFKLFDHLQALKSYMLLGAGDFIAVLMESLASNLDRPANTQYRHTLTAQLEHAVRNSNAQHDTADVLRRLDSRMLELSHGEIGWDVFTLEYKIDAPVDVIVTPYGSKQYLKVFNFLWRVKRVEFALGSTWRRCMTGARGVLGTVDDKFGKDWKKARCAMAEMVHFVNQLQHYILFEVIESSWIDLQKALNKPESTLDDMIDAHAKYLNNITRKGLLGSQSIDFTGQLHELLKNMLAYKDTVDSLYSFSVAEFTRRQEAAAKIETRTAAGRWGLSERESSRTSTPDPFAASRGALRHDPESPFPPPLLRIGNGGSGEDDVLPALRQRLGTLAAEFGSRICLLLGDLVHSPDGELKMLAVNINLNDVYKPERRRRKGDKKREKEKETPAVPRPTVAT
ncbi:Microtubule-nucleating Tub4p (gamma-tubulin) complex component [Didymella heteroderae]|uniref:Microtubule-nucleating Tub4p (Gamma-tubulin) complex component n=1 Tax=Didymella heteroderae TaxID=1769908 RepID=A0A9P5BYM8_9PLEO|nr:Microtubule-nucleating Tub4p (gamma-tubulin) complex component [Didymella heteroderae]